VKGIPLTEISARITTADATKRHTPGAENDLAGGGQQGTVKEDAV
jgi:hypothetical protein